jgi:hypothetical protein
MKRLPSRAESCTGKGAMSALEAKKLARRIREKGERVIAYRCIHCAGSWHVGNTNTSKGMRRKPEPVYEGDEQ